MEHSILHKRLLFLGRSTSLFIGSVAGCAVGPIIGFNVYINAFKAIFALDQTNGKFLYQICSYCIGLISGRVYSILKL